MQDRECRTYHNSRVSVAQSVISRKLAEDLWILAVLLRDTQRLNEALPLMERAKEIFQQFERRNGYPDPHWEGFIAFYVQMLQAAEEE